MLTNLRVLKIHKHNRILILHFKQTEKPNKTIILCHLIPSSSSPKKHKNFLTFNITHRLTHECVYNTIMFLQILKNFSQHSW
jgi:hypothetical protein